MRIIKEKTIKDYYEKHSNAKSPLRGWLKIVKKTKFSSLADIKKIFPSADLVGNFVVFNIGGNNYRLVAYIKYESGILYIRHIMTHAEYDKKKWKNDPWFNGANN